MPRRPSQVVVSNEDIGRRLRLLRQEQGLSQVELAKRAQMIQPNISAIERGARGVTVHQVVRLARALGVTTDRILVDEKVAENTHPPKKRLMRRLVRVQELPDGDQRILLQLLDGMLMHREERQRKKAAAPNLPRSA